MNKKPDRASPLRRIVRLEDRAIQSASGEGVIGWRTVEILECGHEQSIKKDIYGETDGERRRCAQCSKEGRS